jgi:hypothetical protein
LSSARWATRSGSDAAEEERRKKKGGRKEEGEVNYISIGGRQYISIALYTE